MALLFVATLAYDKISAAHRGTAADGICRLDFNDVSVLTNLSYDEVVRLAHHLIQFKCTAPMGQSTCESV